VGELSEELDDLKAENDRLKKTFALLEQRYAQLQAV